MITFLWLLVGHAVADYPLQGDFLARGKNHRNPILGVPFWHCLSAHAMIHAGVVALITGSWVLGACEYVLHVAIDYGKCDERYGLNVDQLLHFLCKALWAVLR
jgi:hypothetical protein